MPQMGQLPGASRTISGCIGQVYFIAWLPVVAGSDVLQPVSADRATPSNSVITVQFILFIVLSLVVYFRFAVTMTEIVLFTVSHFADARHWR